MTEQVFKTVKLDTPLKRGEKEVTEIQIRKPKAGELRGVSLASLVQMEVSEISKVLPRITQPTLTDEEIGNLDAADLMQLGSEVAGFLLPKALKADYLTK